MPEDQNTIYRALRKARDELDTICHDGLREMINSPLTTTEILKKYMDEWIYMRDEFDKRLEVHPFIDPKQ